MSDPVLTPAKPPFVRVMSGMRVSGMLHIGHYFGALKNWLALQEQHECFFGIMDWHGMTSTYKSIETTGPQARSMFIDFLSFGLNPEKSVIFVQSHVPEHLELFFIFANLTPMGWLERVPTWKDAEEEAKATDTHNLGRFSYPVLQTADVAIYKGNRVPVGADQVAHLELSREIIRRFNRLYKIKWPEPAPLLTETPLVPGLDGRKMSKSYDNGILLSETPQTIAKKVKGMPTDPQRIRREDVGNPEVCNVFTFHGLFSSAEDLEWVRSGCTTAGIGCGDCKQRLIDRIEAVLQEPREKRNELLNKPKEVDSMMEAGSLRARQIARENLREIKEKLKLF